MRSILAYLTHILTPTYTNPQIAISVLSNSHLSPSPKRGAVTFMPVFKDTYKHIFTTPRKNPPRYIYHRHIKSNTNTFKVQHPHPHTHILQVHYVLRGHVALRQISMIT